MRGFTLFIPFFLFLVTLLLYIHNLSQSVYGGDVGDLVTSAFLGGVAHAPGYPLFTFLGFLLTRFTFFPSPAFAVGLISTTSGALGALLYYLTTKQLTKNTYISILSTLVLIFSYFFWFYSEIAEVFSLNAFFLILMLYLGVKIYKNRSAFLFPLFFFILGLSLTNHQTIILAFPSLFLLLFPIFLRTKEKTRILIFSLICLLGGLLVYIYVPIAASRSPAINWDNVKDIPSFVHLVLRQDYGTFSAGYFSHPSFLQRLILVKVYASEVLFQLTIPVICLCLLGAFFLFRKNKLLTLSFFLGFLLTGPVFIAYAGFPVTGNFYFGVNERFFLLSTVFILSFLPWGLLFLTKVFKKFTQVPVGLFLSIFLIIPWMLCIYNFPKTNLSQLFVGDYYGEDVLQNLPHGALVFLGGDTGLFNTWYVHYAKGVRPDVKILNINGSVGSPYYATLENTYKKVHPHASSAEVKANIIPRLPQNGSVFSQQELQPNTGQKFIWIPKGLVYQLISPQHLPTEEAFTKEQNIVWSSMHIPYLTDTNTLALGNVTISDIPNAYANAMLTIGDYYISAYNDKIRAKYWYDAAKKVAPEYDRVYSIAGIFYLTVQKSCIDAQNNFTKAIFLNPVEPANYLLLYTTDSSCLRDATQANKVKILFEKEFQTPFTKYFSGTKKRT